MNTINYKTNGVCSRNIEILIDDNNIIRSCNFVGGCHGNTQGISKLVVGMDNVTITKTTSHGVYINAGTVTVTANNTANNGLTISSASGHDIAMEGGSLTADTVTITENVNAKKAISVKNATLTLTNATINLADGVDAVRVQKGTVTINTKELKSTAASWTYKKLSYFTE